MLKQKGLTKREADKKLRQYGLNEIKDSSKATPLKILLRQIKNNFIVYLLLAAMLISFFVGKSLTAYVILAVILMVIVVGFIQEYHSEKAISALKNMLTATAMVIRDSRERLVETIKLVPGDILLLRNGEKIPADCILLEASDLRVNEAVLTGESKDVKKQASNTKKTTAKNLVFMGTYIVNGRAVAKILHTGANTKFGQIAGLISTTEKDLPLQKKINKIAKYMATLAVIVSLATGLIMFLRAGTINSEVLINILILIIALSVSAFPEGFPVVLITTLSSGAYRMAKKNAIVNRMSIIETLGETTVICSDKTGTITKGEMTVNKIFINDTWLDVSGVGYETKGNFLFKNKKVVIEKQPNLKLLLANLVLCNDAYIEKNEQTNEFKVNGSSTEVALLILAAKAKLFKEDLTFKRIQEMPFNSERKMMSVLCSINQEKVVYAKGALEYLIKHCTHIQKKDRVVELTDQERKKIFSANNEMTLQSLRTLAVAYKKVETITKNHFEENLIFVGLVGMEDAPRAEVKESIKQCKNAGINVKIITGDNENTALSIARQVGLRGKLMLGQDIDNLTDDELKRSIGNVAVFARVNPEHKLRLIKALKANGEVVTMTGDGVNDAPALKEAHIGVAMGKNGTDVSRSVADLTLKDDNFSTIVSAISEGRTIFKNIRKFVTYQLSCNFAELSILFIGVLLAPLLGWQVPLLLALHLLFMNLVTDNLPAITLGFNSSSQDVMIEQPRKNAEILNKRLVGLLIFNGSLLMLFTLLSYFLAFNFLGKDLEYARTVALFTLIGLEIVSAFNFRSFRKLVLTRSLFVNPSLFYASAVSLLATLAIIYTPLNKLFETVALGLDGFIIVIISALILATIFDVLKIINNKRQFFPIEHF